MSLKNQDDRGDVADEFRPGANANLKTILGIMFKKASTHKCVALLSTALLGH